MIRDAGMRGTGQLIPLAALPLLVSLPETGRISERGLTFHVNRRFALFLIPSFLTFLVMGQLGFPLLTKWSSFAIHGGVAPLRGGSVSGL